METLDGILFSYIVFFSVLFFLVTYGGFGEYISAGSLPTPTTASSGWDLLNPLSSSSIYGYFFSIMTYNYNMGIFTTIFSGSFLFIVAVWLSRWARGN